MLFSGHHAASRGDALARRHLNRPVHVRAEGSDEPVHAPDTEQHVFRIHHMDKVEVLARVQAGRRPRRPDHGVLP